MVVVLIASLTTATYAWITESSTVMIDSIDFAVGAGADLIIGVHKDNSLKKDAVYSDFRSGSTTYTSGSTFADAGTWEGTEALGSNIDFNGLDLKSISKAVGTGKFTGTKGGTWTKGENGNSFTDGTGLNGSADDKFTYANYVTGMIKAEGSAGTYFANSVDTAWKQFDYLDVVIGVQATKSNLQSMTCYVTVNPTSGSIIGMNAAIHVAYEVVKPGAESANTLTDKDIYEGYSFKQLNTAVTNETYNAAKTAAKDTGKNTLKCLGGSETVELSAGAMTLAIELDKLTGEEVIDMDGIYQIHLVVYVAGFDTDCQEGAKGVGSTIYVTFAGTAKEA